MWLVYTREAPEPQGRVKLCLYFKTMAAAGYKHPEQTDLASERQVSHACSLSWAQDFTQILKIMYVKMTRTQKRTRGAKDTYGRGRGGVSQWARGGCAQDLLSTYMKSRLNTTHCNKIKFESFFLILITYYCLIKFPQIWYLETTIIDLLHPGKNPSMLQPSET